MAQKLQQYLANLTVGRLILWCYLIWYLVVLVQYFDPSPSLWITSLGLAGIIGTALIINAGSSGPTRRLDFWPAFRFYLTPFCVSSFAALVKGKGFLLVFSPHLGEMLVALGLCAALWTVAALARRGVSDISQHGLSPEPKED